MKVGPQPCRMVAQISNLLYRRIPFGRPAQLLETSLGGDGWRIGNRVAAGATGVVLTAGMADGLTTDAVSSKCEFQRRGFYLRGCWVMNHPFSVRSWERADFATMFRLLRDIGYNTVMLAAPMLPKPGCCPGTKP